MPILNFDHFSVGTNLLILEFCAAILLLFITLFLVGVLSPLIGQFLRLCPVLPQTLHLGLLLST